MTGEHTACYQLIPLSPIFAAIHIIGYSFNFYHIATQPVDFLCIFSEIYFRDNFQPKVHFWLFGNVIGELMCLHA